MVGADTTLDQIKQRQQSAVDQKVAEEQFRQKQVDAINAMEAHVVASMEHVYTKLRTAGVTFEDVKPAVSKLNFAYKLAGASPLHIVQSKDDDRFLVAEDMGRRFPLIVPAGLDRLLSMRLNIDGPIIDRAGNIDKQCKARLDVEYFGEYNLSPLGTFACTAFLQDRHLSAVKDSFSAWLAIAIPKQEK